MKLWFMALSFWLQFGLVAASVAAVGGGVWYVHHHIYQSGYDARVAEEKAAADKAAADAQAKIAKIGDKYAPIHEKLRQSPDYMRPVSPLVGSAIGSLPNPAPRPR